MKLVLLFAVAALGAQTPRSAQWNTQRAKAARAPLPFRALGLYCGGEAQVRASKDLVAWTDWLSVKEEDGSGALAYFDELHSFAETDRDCRVLLIDAGEKAEEKPAGVRAAVDAPSIVTREKWGCTPATCPSPDAPIYSTVTHLIVHHSAGANASNDWPGVVRSIWVLHVRGNGWNDIGYNYLVDPNGVVYEGRAGGDGVIGAHFSGVNTGTMGVCMLGTYSALAPTKGSMESLRQMLAWQAAKWKIDPGGRSLHASSGLVLNNVSGHRDAGLSPRASGTTECPGNGVYTLLPQTRGLVRGAVEDDCPLIASRANACVAGAGDAFDVAYSLPPGCALKAQSRVAWMETEQGDGLIRLRIAANGGGDRSGSLSLNGQQIEIVQAASGKPAPPCIEFHGVVNSASFDTRPLGQGSIFSIFGENFGENPQVQVNGRAAQIFYAGQGQINALLPTPTDTGSARLSVNAQERLIWVTEAAPAIFYTTSPVRAGDTLTIYLTGASRATTMPWSASMGTNVSHVAAEGVPGVTRAAVRIPQNLEPGEYPLTITVAGSASPPVTIEVVK